MGAGSGTGARTRPRVIGLGERYAYQRLAFRTWVILLPLAASRGDASVAEHWERWWAEAADHFPSTPSPYARVLHGAIPVWVAQATGRQVVPPADDLTESMIPMGNPHFIAAVETIVRAWLDVGRGPVERRRALRRKRRRPARDPMMGLSGSVDAWGVAPRTRAERRGAGFRARGHGGVSASRGSQTARRGPGTRPGLPTDRSQARLPLVGTTANQRPIRAPGKRPPGPACPGHKRAIRKILA